MKKKKNFSTILLILLFLLGLCILLYPTISNYINQRNQSRAIASYDKSVKKMTDKDYEAYFKAADEYNQALAKNPDLFYYPNRLSGYNDILDISGTGVMGYITIQKIGVELPIYHGIDVNTLEVAVGHLEGSSLPVGGESTHSVLSAHRGLPSAKLFTDLDKMEVGDTFTITILNRVLTYEVDHLAIVVPENVDDLQIEGGKDYCTLMTCTPYGINTHRLLVRGHRIKTVEQKNIYVTADAFQIEPIITAPIIAIPILILLLIWVLIHTKKKKEE